MAPLLAVALNGSRRHPRAPRTPADLAEAARSSVEAGAEVLHLHAFDTTGVETLAAEPCAAALAAVRAVCPGVPISLSTSAQLSLILGTAVPSWRRGRCCLIWSQRTRVRRGSGSCVRVLVEPLDADPRDAVAHAAAMEEVLSRAGIGLEQIHHGDGIASWAVNERALGRGHGIRTGLEDTPVLPDGRPALDNAALVRAAALMRAAFGSIVSD
jgi:uncharacterized protein (DUF849 family)